jgi:hypothetical protein
MRGEKRMITADFVFGAIDGLVSRFDNGDYIVPSYCEDCFDEEDEENYEIEFEIDREMEMMLNGLNIQYSVELIDVFSNPAIDIMVLCIAFVVDGKLYTKNFTVERR